MTGKEAIEKLIKLGILKKKDLKDYLEAKVSFEELSVKAGFVKVTELKDYRQDKISFKELQTKKFTRWLYEEFLDITKGDYKEDKKIFINVLKDVTSMLENDLANEVKTIEKKKESIKRKDTIKKDKNYEKIYRKH